MCDDTQCYILSTLALAAFSLPLPLLLLAGIAFGRHLRRWEWVLGAVMVAVAAPMSFLLTAYFFIGLPLVAIIAALAAILARFPIVSRVVLIAPILLYILWWIVAGVWAVDCPNCGEGDGDRSYAWGVGGLLLASPLAALLLSLEFGRVAAGRLLWRQAARPGW